MSKEFVPYHMMHFQKLKHLATRNFETKLSEKSKQTLPQPSLFIQKKIYLLTKRKKENKQKYSHA